jgi:hypothetical protein
LIDADSGSLTGEQSGRIASALSTISARCRRNRPIVVLPAGATRRRAELPLRSFRDQYQIFNCTIFDFLPKTTGAQTVLARQD